MAYVVRRLQKMDLTFFHAHGAGKKSRQRAINLDRWVVPALGPPRTVLLRYRDRGNQRLVETDRKFGLLQKNFRLHGRMIPGQAFGELQVGDLILMRFVGDTVTWATFDGRRAGDRRLFDFLLDSGNCDWRGNMGIVRGMPSVRHLEDLLGGYDPALFFATELEGTDDGPQSVAIVRSLRRVMSAEAFRKLQQSWESNGARGELHVVSHERSRLTALGRADLADRVEHVSAVEPFSPFDVLSFEGQGAVPESPRFIEVKSTSGTGVEFEMSEAEWRFAEEKRHEHFVYRVTKVNDQLPEILIVPDIVGDYLENRVERWTRTYRVRLA